MRNHIIRLTVFALAALIAPVASAQVDLDYAVERGFFKLPDGWNFGQTPGAAVTADGHILIFHRADHKLIEFDPTGEFVRELAPGQFEGPHGLRVDADGKIWTTDTITHQVLRFDRNGRLELVLGVKGQAGILLDTLGLHAHRFNQPTDIAFDSDRNIYVADGYGNSRIVKFDRYGEFIKAWGEKGSDPGQFNIPHTVLVDANDRLWVGDRTNARIQIFDLDGNLLEIWDHVGYPWGLSPASDGNVWMPDGTANRIVKLDLDGQILGHFGEGGREVGKLGWVHYVVELQDGSMVAGEIVSHRPQRFVPR